MKKDLEIQGLDANTTFEHAASVMILDRLDNMLAHEPGVRQGEDIEELHDMRVYSRRLREALRIFKPCFPKKEYKSVYARVRDVTRALGEVRNLDVFISYFRAFKEVGEPDASCARAADALISWAEKQRDALRDDMIKSLDKLDTACLAQDVRAMAAAAQPEEPKALLLRFAAEGLPVAQAGGPGSGVQNAELVMVRPGQPGFPEAAARELMARGCIRPREYKEYRDVARGVGAPAQDQELPLLIGDPAAEYAKRIIPARFAVVARMWREAMLRRDNPDIAALHALRISFKKLRYAFEILYVAFEEEKRDAVYARMKHFQDILGDLHDADVFYELGCGKMKSAVKKDKMPSALGYALLAHRLRLRRDELAAEFCRVADEYPLESLQQELWAAFHAAYAPPAPAPELYAAEDMQTQEAPDDEDTDGDDQ
jgi:CHAD domain-containing protein